MAEKIEGRRGELLRMGLGARNWVLTHIDDNSDVMAWKPNDDAKSSSEIIEHIAWTLSAVCSHISEELSIDLDTDNIPMASEENPLVSDVRAAYVLFKRLCGS
ncbi:MAG: hypothetical protein KAQ65_03635, partial [Candidatus Thorarchaeota archaeon]|nr:hypothetical protein [Candidatus Thorarchaeota archaeon]